MRSCPVQGLGNRVAGGGLGKAGLAWLQDELSFPGPAER